MKILENRPEHLQPKYRFRCSNCQSLIEYVKTEAVVGTDKIEGDYHTVTCPVCLFTTTWYNVHPYQGRKPPFL